MTCKRWQSPNGHVAKISSKGDCKSRPLAMSFQVVVLYRHILLLHFTQTCVHVWLKETSAVRILHFHGSGAAWLRIQHSMASPELQALMAQMREFFAAMMQQQQTAMEAMLNNERGRPAAQAQGINEKYYKRVESSLESRRGATGRSNSSQRPRRPTKQRTT